MTDNLEERNEDRLSIDRSVTKWSIIHSVWLFDARSRVKAWAELILKEFLFPFSLDSATVRWHFKKRGNTKWRRPLSVTAPTFGDVMAYFQSSVAWVEYLCAMPTGSFVQLLSRLADIGFSATATEDDVDDVRCLARHRGFDLKNFSIFHDERISL